MVEPDTTVLAKQPPPHDVRSVAPAITGHNEPISSVTQPQQLTWQFVVGPIHDLNFAETMHVTEILSKPREGGSVRSAPVPMNGQLHGGGATGGGQHTTRSPPPIWSMGVATLLVPPSVPFVIFLIDCENRS